MPLLVFLHGHDEGAPTPLEAGVTRHGPLRPGTPDRVADEFLIVAPQLPRRGDLWRHYAAETASVVDYVAGAHSADEGRVYLTGFSFGGNGVFDLAIEQPRRWAALWAVDPTRVPLRDPARPVWLSVGQVARFRRAAFVQALALEPPGGVDSRRIYTDDGDDHVGAATRAYADSRIYDWLLAHRRE